MRHAGASPGPRVSVGDLQGEAAAGSSGIALDLIQLAGLTAGASSAASSTAYAVDAVVKEALLFFCHHASRRQFGSAGETQACSWRW